MEVLCLTIQTLTIPLIQMAFPGTVQLFSKGMQW